MEQKIQPEIVPQHDVIELPSQGLFYPHKKGKVKIAYLTAQDENILTSPNLLNSGKVLDVLLEGKILDKDINADDLLSGDRNAILFFLRATGYGEKYPVTLIDPKTKDEFQYEVDLSEIPIKEIKVTPDENGEVEFVLPISKRTIKFRYLTAIEESRLVESEEARQKATNSNVSNVMTKRLEEQIMEVDGVRERSEILLFIAGLRVGDSGKLREFMRENEPGLDTQIEVSAPSGATFHIELPITLEFFWPYL